MMSIEKTESLMLHSDIFVNGNLVKLVKSWFPRKYIKLTMEFV